MFWKNFLEDQFFDPPNQYVWWDMYYRYRYDIMDAIGILDEVDDTREDNENLSLSQEEGIIEDKKYLKERAENIL